MMGRVTTDIDGICLISCVEVMDDGRFVEICQFSHIACFVELGRIDFVNVFGVDIFFLSSISISIVSKG